MSAERLKYWKKRPTESACPFNSILIRAYVSVENFAVHHHNDCWIATSNVIICAGAHFCYWNFSIIDESLVEFNVNNLKGRQINSTREVGISLIIYSFQRFKPLNAVLLTTLYKTIYPLFKKMPFFWNWCLFSVEVPLMRFSCSNYWMKLLKLGTKWHPQWTSFTSDLSTSALQQNSLLKMWVVHAVDPCFANM